MLGYGFDPELSEGSLKPPIFLTSTFVFENAAAGKRFFEGVTGKRPGGAEGLIYSRFNGPNQEILEDRLARVGRRRRRARLLERHVGDRDSAADLRPARRLRRPFGPALCRDRDPDRQDPRPVRRHWVDFPSGATREEIDAAIATGKEKGRVSLIYLESPANPTNHAGRRRGGRRRARRRFRRRTSGRRLRSTTPSSGRCGPSRSRRARTCRFTA